MPAGRYLAPANGPDCIETAPGYGDCGVRTLVLTGPPLYRFDLRTSKRVTIAGSTTFELRAELLNAFITPWFEAVSTTSTNPDNWRVTDAQGAFSESGPLVWTGEGSHTLRVQVGGALSNTVSFVVSSCPP